MGPEHKFAIYTLPRGRALLDDAGLQFQVRSSCSVQWSVKFVVRRLQHYVEPIATVVHCCLH